MNRTSFRFVHALLLGLALGLGACNKTDVAPAAGDAAPATSAAAPSASAPAAGTAANTADEARAIVTKWSAALDRHDIDALAALYADRVAFYGKELPRATILDAKKRAFKTAPGFHQSITGDIQITEAAGAFTASLTKRAGATPASMKNEPARVVVKNGQVVEETDQHADARARDARAGDTCEGVATGAVNALPAVKKLLADDARAIAKKPGYAIGGMAGSTDDGDLVSGGLGVHSPERYEAQVWYRVDATGKLFVEVLGEDAVIPAADQAAVAKACKPH